MPDTILDLYRQRAAAGLLEQDAAQEAVIRKLDALAVALADYRLVKKSGALGWLFAAKKQEPPKGLYVWGSVGRGKTMLMDLFFDAARVERKRRVHFHAFMADVHRRVHAWRKAHKEGAVKGDDPVPPIANQLADEAALLCFDEFAVNDIADAMILGRLFEVMFARGVVLVATSNVAPEDLYKDGLNRALFLPFIEMIRGRMETLRLDSRTDFRLEKLEGAPVYLTPPDAKAAEALGRAFQRLSGAPHGRPVRMTVLGRAVEVPEAAGGVARFAFRDLCDVPLGPSDYLELAERFHTFVIDGVPRMGLAQRNAAKRFITLIDALYDYRCKLIASAEAEPHELYAADQGREVFEFERTASRLIEMRSHDYLALPHGRAAKPGSAAEGIVET